MDDMVVTRRRIEDFEGLEFGGMVWYEDGVEVVVMLSCLGRPLSRSYRVVAIISSWASGRGDHRRDQEEKFDNRQDTS